MPRPTIPYKSLRYFSNRKYSTFARSHKKTNSDSQTIDNPEGQSCHVNNILVFPRNSETTINVLSNKDRSFPYGNLLKKIKGRKRKEKQRLKKKHNFEGDVKPVISKMKSSNKMEPKLNKHIIFLSDSENENDDKPNDTSILSEVNTTENCDLNSEDDDDVIFVETPAAEVIEIDDSTEQNDSSEKDLGKSDDPENSLDANDFLDNAHMNSKDKFNFELHGSEFKGAEFLKPSTIPKDMSESGSVSSVSDVSTPIPMNVFNVIDFPQEKDNLFDDNNLEKFRNAITPQRSHKKLRNTLRDDEFATPESRGNQKNPLPTLSEIQNETEVRKQRGRSIIKELVNDRAYVLLSAAQKKNKNKKRKSKDELSDTFEEENSIDSQELNRKKKKKKSKKQEFPTPAEMNDEITESPLRTEMKDIGKNKKPKDSNQDNANESSIDVCTDLSESSPIHTYKKSRKNKRQDSEESVDENADKKKRKLNKNAEDPSNCGTSKSGNDSTPMLPDITECSDEKKRRKSKKTSSETSAEHDELKLKYSRSVEDNNDEKKRKKSKKYIPTDELVEVPMKNVDIPQHEYKTSENKKERELGEEFGNERKKKSKKNISGNLPEEEIVKNASGISQKKHDLLEKRKDEEAENCHYHVTDKKKKSKKTISTDLSEAEIIQERHEPLENRKEEEKETSDEHINEKKKSKKSISTDSSEEVMKNVAEIPQNEHGLLGNRKQEEKVNEPTSEKEEAMKNVVDIPLKDEENRKQEEKQQGDAYVFKNSTTQENNCINDEIIPIKSEESLNTQNKNVDIEEDKSVEEQEASGDKSDANTIEKEAAADVITENIRYYDSGKGEEFDEEKRVEKGMEETSDDITQKNNNEEILVVIEVDNEEKNEKKERKISEVSENTVKNEGNVPPIIEEHNDERKKKKTKRNVEVQTVEPKRIKLNNEEMTSNVAGVSQPQNEKVVIRNEEVRKEIFNEASSDNNITTKSMEVSSCLYNRADEITNDKEHAVNTSNNVKDKGEMEKLAVSSDKPVNPDEELILEQSVNIENTNLKEGTRLDHMVVVDTEGNVDMKLTSIFSTANKSFFPEGNNFAIDVDLDNFSDKYSASWNTQPSKFRSYNGSLFEDEIKQELAEKTDDHSSTKSVTEVITISSEPNQSTMPIVSSSDSVPPATSLENTEEIILVEKEANATSENENNPDVILEENVVVKEEKESEPVAETNLEEPSNLSEECLEELPDEIEEIFKEKDNHNTVKRLCDFLEEVRDPKEVLKKVSLLKQAFKDKAQDSRVPNEEVEIIEDKDDVLSISSSESSVLCLDDDVAVVGINDDITLANCDLTEIDGKDRKEDEVIDLLETNHSDDNTVQRNDNIEKTQSTSQATSNSRSKSREEMGLDKYEVEDIQETMTDDPKLWKIVAEDLCPVKLPSKGKRCIKCREIGHLGYNCPNKLNLPKCPLCGMEGHLDFKCPNRICTQCGRRTPMMQNCCDHCKHYRNVTCVLCKNKGHPRYKCPDLWRRYHLTVNHGPLVQREPLKLKDRRNLWCSSCARSGHVESECEVSWRKFKHFQPLDPRIHHYVDVYK